MANPSFISASTQIANAMTRTGLELAVVVLTPVETACLRTLSKDALQLPL
jgi:hypothetical protein